MLKSRTLISVGNCRAQLNAELTHSIASCPVDLLGPDQRSKSPLQATYACAWVCVCVFVVIIFNYRLFTVRLPSEINEHSALIYIKRRRTQNSICMICLFTMTTTTTTTAISWEQQQIGKNNKRPTGQQLHSYPQCKRAQSVVQHSHNWPVAVVSQGRSLHCAGEGAGRVLTGCTWNRSSRWELRVQDCNYCVMRDRKT